MADIRDERRNIADRDKELVAEWRALEMELITRYEEQGVQKATTDAGTASITEMVVPQVVDWDAVYEHIKETGDFYLLQKRPAAAAFRELHEGGIEVPGIQPYTKKTISLRKA
jgi:hypothetical protein